MEGEFYTEVDASVLNPGISPMAMISGDPEPPEGATTQVVWIRWRYDDQTGAGGFIGTGWFINDTTNVLRQYATTDEEFMKWLVDQGGNGPNLLNEALASWNGADKTAFLNNNRQSLYDGDCLSFL